MDKKILNSYKNYKKIFQFNFFSSFRFEIFKRNFGKMQTIKTYFFDF